MELWALSSSRDELQVALTEALSDAALAEAMIEELRAELVQEQKLALERAEEHAAEVEAVRKEAVAAVESQAAEHKILLVRNRSPFVALCCCLVAVAVFPSATHTALLYFRSMMQSQVPPKISNRSPHSLYPLFPALA